MNELVTLICIGYNNNNNNNNNVFIYLFKKV